MGGGVNTSATRLEALNIQSSTAGAVIPWLRGKHRIPGNLLWYGDFKATAHTESSGGKGGGGTSTSYTYSASLIMGMCHGSINGVTKIWKGKGTSTPTALGLAVYAGGIGQPTWPGLTGRGAQALNYSGLAYVCALNYALGDSASVENHSFEVQHTSAYAVDASTPDVDPKTATYDLLTHPHQGAAFPTALIGDWTDWSNYCIANKLLVSPLLTTQGSARDALQTMADLTNTAIVWSDGKLKMRPRGDAAATAYGRTYTPNTTPVYQLDDNCFLKNGSEPPVKRSLKSPADRKNIVKVQYKDRANGYNEAVVEAKDITDITANGARPLDQISADWICSGDVARFVAEIRKQRELFVLGEYSFRLPWHYALIECADLLTLTDSVLLIDNVPVLVKTITEESDEELAFTCEDYPAGVASAPLYPSQGMTGFALNANVSPGDALAPVIFELPGALTTTGLELAIATGSTNANWGGCQVWVSYDGATYRQLTELRGNSRFGTLQADNGSNLQVYTDANQQLLSGSAADAASLETLLYVAPAGAVAGEYLAYQTASLTGANAYTLAGLVRGAYGTSSVTHATATPWVRVDDAIARSGALDPALIGKTVYVKLLSFNVFGGGQQSLADVSATTYTITGKHYVLGRPSSSLGIKINQDSFTAQNYNEAYIHGRDASGAAVDGPGTILLNGVATAVPNGQLNTNRGPAAGYIVWSTGAPFDFSPLGAGITRPYAFVRRYQGNWQYDNNGTDWVTFAVVPGQHYVIGTMATGATDAGAPGAPPGITEATMWASASTLASLESTADDAYFAAVDAKSAAVTAGNNANTALSTLATMRSNGYIDASEKPALIKEAQTIFDEYPGIYGKGTTYGLTTLRNAYASAYSALGTYLNSLAPAWNDTTTDTPITPATDQAKWTDYYNARTALLNAVYDETAKRANWDGISGQKTFRVIAKGNSATSSPASAGLYAQGVSVAGGGRSYVLAIIRRSDGALMSAQQYDVYGVGANAPGRDAAALAAALNGVSSAYIVVVYTDDEPQANRLTGGLPDALYRCGASRSVFGSSQFKYRAAYVLVGIGGCGEGNGAEAYQGDVDDDVDAWVDVAFQVVGGNLVGVTSNYTPRSLLDYGYSGDLDATKGAPAGTYVAGQLAQDLVTTASNAATIAGTAATNAGAALSTLATMRNNGYLDASEKPALIKEWQAIYDERAGIYTQGTTYGLTTLRDAYQTAFTNLASYLGGLSPSWSNTTVDTPITPATDVATWAAYYSARQALLNAVADETAKRAVWASVSGSGKPADNATVGATFGTNISGQASTSDIGSTAITVLATFTGSVSYSNIA